MLYIERLTCCYASFVIVRVLGTVAKPGGYRPPFGSKKKRKRGKKRTFSALTRFVCSDRGL